METSHDGAVAVVGADGSLVASSGEIDRVFFLRSSAKPFQALVSQEAGAGLSPLELAIVSASHRGFPVHVALVASVLARSGLDETALQTPPDWPIGSGAARALAGAGAVQPRRIWHNCSGKHAGFLRACVAQGWPTDTYLSPDHPLQRRVFDLVSELGDHSVEPVGLDGCGAPVLRTTVRAMALMFSRLATEERLSGVFQAMHRYPALVAANGEGDTEIAIATNSVAKGGAAGCVGVSVAGRMGVAVKSWDGLNAVANAGAVAALRQMGVLSPTASSALKPIGEPPAMGGGLPVGSFESRLELTPA